MTARETHNFKMILEAQQVELIEALRNRGGIWIETSADEMEEVQLAAERELAVSRLRREAIRLRNVQAALRRVQQGAYGICTHCEAEISLRRLEAVPWTPLCIHCQEAVDRGEENTIETVGWLLASAA